MRVRGFNPFVCPDVELDVDVGRDLEQEGGESRGKGGGEVMSEGVEGEREVGVRWADWITEAKIIDDHTGKFRRGRPLRTSPPPSLPSLPIEFIQSMNMFCPSANANTPNSNPVVAVNTTNSSPSVNATNPETERTEVEVEVEGSGEGNAPQGNPPRGNPPRVTRTLPPLNEDTVNAILKATWESNTWRACVEEGGG